MSRVNEGKVYLHVLAWLFSLCLFEGLAVAQTDWLRSKSNLEADLTKIIVETSRTSPETLLDRLEYEIQLLRAGPDLPTRENQFEARRRAYFTNISQAYDVAFDGVWSPAADRIKRLASEIEQPTPYQIVLMTSVLLRDKRYKDAAELIVMRFEKPFRYSDADINTFKARRDQGRQATDPGIMAVWLAHIGNFLDPEDVSAFADRLLAVRNTVDDDLTNYVTQQEVAVVDLLPFVAEEDRSRLTKQVLFLCDTCRPFHFAKAGYHQIPDFLEHSIDRISAEQIVSLTLTYWEKMGFQHRLANSELEDLDQYPDILVALIPKLSQQAISDTIQRLDKLISAADKDARSVAFMKAFRLALASFKDGTEAASFLNDILAFRDLYPEISKHKVLLELAVPYKIHQSGSLSNKEKCEFLHQYLNWQRTRYFKLGDFQASEELWRHSCLAVGDDAVRAALLDDLLSDIMSRKKRSDAHLHRLDWDRLIVVKSLLDTQSELWEPTARGLIEHIRSLSRSQLPSDRFADRDAPDPKKSAAADLLEYLAGKLPKDLHKELTAEAYAAGERDEFSSAQFALDFIEAREKEARDAGSTDVLEALAARREGVLKETRQGPYSHGVMVVLHALTAGAPDDRRWEMLEQIMVDLESSLDDGLASSSANWGFTTHGTMWNFHQLLAAASTQRALLPDVRDHTYQKLTGLRQRFETAERSNGRPFYFVNTDQIRRAQLQLLLQEEALRIEQVEQVLVSHSGSKGALGALFKTLPRFSERLTTEEIDKLAVAIIDHALTKDASYHSDEDPGLLSLLAMTVDRLSVDQAGKLRARLLNRLGHSTSRKEANRLHVGIALLRPEKVDQGYISDLILIARDPFFQNPQFAVRALYEAVGELDDSHEAGPFLSIDVSLSELSFLAETDFMTSLDLQSIQSTLETIMESRWGQMNLD